MTTANDSFTALRQSRWRDPLNWPLAFKIMVPMVLMVVLGASLHAFITARTTERILAARLGESFTAQAQGLGQQLHSLLDESVGQLQAITLIDTVTVMVAEQNGSYTEGESAATAQIQQIDRAWATAANEDPIVQAIISSDEAVNPLVAQLQGYLAAFPTHAEIFVTDRFGATVAATTRPTDYYQADEAWWQTAWNGGVGAIYISEPQWDESAGVTALQIAVPIYDQQSGSVIGIMRSTMKLDEFYAVIGDWSAGETGSAFLLNSAGALLFDPREEQGGVAANLSTDLLKSLADADTGYQRAPDLAGQDIIFGHADLSHRDLPATTAAETLVRNQAIADLGWVLVVRQQAAEAFDVIATIAQATVITSAVIVALIVLVAVFIVRSIVRPIRALDEAAGQIAAGHLEAAIPAGGLDEVGSLANSLSHMVSQLRQSVADAHQRTLAVETSAEVSRQLSTILDAKELTSVVAGQVQHAFNYYHTQIYLWDDARQNLVLVGGTGDAGQTLLARGHSIPQGRGLVGRAAEFNRPVIVPDVSQQAGWLANPLLPETRAEIAVPIRRGDWVMGVLDVQQNHVNGLSQTDADLLLSISGQLGIALENAALLREREEAIENMRAEQARLQRIFDNVTIPMLIMSASSDNIQFSNQPLAGLLQLPQETNEVGDQDFVLTGAYRQEFINALKTVVDGQEMVENLELELKRATGKPFWALISSHRVEYRGEQAHLITLIDIQEQKQSEGLLERQANELAAVAEVSTVAASILEPRLLLQETVDLTRRRFGLYHAHIHLLDESGDTLVLTAGAGTVGRKMVAEGRRIPLDSEGSLVATTARNNEGAIRYYGSGAEGFMPHPLLMETRSEMAVPLAVGDNVLGVMDVRSTQENAFGEQDLQVYSTLATQIAVALQNARSFARSEETRRELDAITRRLTREGWGSYLDSLASEKTYVYRAAEFGAREGSGDTSDLASADPVRRQLLVQGEAIGELLLPQTEHPRPETNQIVETVLGQLSQHIENLRLNDQMQSALVETKQQANRMALLNRISERITVADTLEEIYEIAASEAAKLFPADRVTLSLLDEPGEKAQVVAFSGERGSIPIGIPQPIEGTLTEKAIVNRKAVVVHDSHPSPGRSINSAMIVPLMSGNQVLGTINIGSQQFYQYDDQDENLTFQMASLLSAAIENQSLYAEQAATLTRLRELDELKSNFLANMSHELRTPLNSIIGFTDVVLEGLDGPLTEAMENDLNIIYRNSHHLLELINDVLDMAKIEAGHMQLSLRRIKVYDILDDVVTTVATLAREKSLSLEMLSANDCVDLQIDGDPLRLRQVLLNLASNAIKFTEKGGVTIDLKRRDEMLRIEVKDTGAGVTDDHIDKIFEAFRQADNSATRKAGGTGLGLPISRRLIELHGGQLWVESSGVEGEGSTFIVELPIEIRQPALPTAAD
ncbi:MAG: GAF domain-containing protein [Anaerolineales bacterium]|nr:GAF domain-containing protein [Anaerolineales bacterium]